jgi:cytoskeleton protein RodZ
MVAARSGTLGQRLRSAREQRGLSIAQIAAATKISKALIEALERDDISRLPGGISGRAFVRAYASEVGLDPDDTLRAFMAQSANPVSSEVEDYLAVDSDRRVASVILQLVLVSVPLVALILYWGRAKPPADAATGSPRQVGEPTESHGSAVPEGSADLLVIRLSAVQDCRVLAIVDGAEKVRRDFRRGEQEVLEVTREALVTVSDAGAIEMRLNGALARPFGNVGQSATIRLTPETFRHFVVPR